MEVSRKSLTDERDQAVSQLGVAFVNMDKLKRENGQLIREIQNLANAQAETNGRLDKLKEQSKVVPQEPSPVGLDPKEYLFGEKADDAASARARLEKSATRQRSVSPYSKYQIIDPNTRGRYAANNEYQRPSSVKPKKAAVADESNGFDDGTHIIPTPRRLFPRTYEAEQTNSTNVTMPKVNNPMQCREQWINTSQESDVADLRAKLENVRSSNNTRPRSVSSESVFKRMEDHRRRLAAQGRPSHTSPNSTSQQIAAPLAEGIENISKTDYVFRHRRTVSDPTSERPKPEKATVEDEVLDDETMSEIDVFLELASEDNTRSTQSSQLNGQQESKSKPILKDQAASLPTLSVRKRVSFSGDEDTQRPSKPPSEAMKGVLQGLETELSQLKRRRDQATKRYDELDKSLGNRKHISLQNDIERINGLMEVKRKQIYGCHDVIEGTKEANALSSP